MSAPYSPRSETSRTAAERIEGHLGRLQALVYSAIFYAGAEGLTRDELEIDLDLKHQTVGPRLRELEDKGLIRDSGRTRLTRSEYDAAVWVATDRVNPLPVEKHSRPTRAEFRAAVAALTALWAQTNGIGFTPELIRVIHWLALKGK